MSLEIYKAQKDQEIITLLQAAFRELLSDPDLNRDVVIAGAVSLIFEVVPKVLGRDPNEKEVQMVLELLLPQK